MTVDIEKLEALAKAATLGPWEASAYGGVHPTGRGGSVVTALTKSGMYDGWAQNASYIAAANPAAILELVAEVRALREYREMARKQVYELMGVVIDIEQFGHGFDDACMNTVKRVMGELAENAARK